MKTLTTVTLIACLISAPVAMAGNAANSNAQSGSLAGANNAANSNAQSGSLAGANNEGNNLTVDQPVTVNLMQEGDRAAPIPTSQELKTVPDVVAPGLTTTLSETCMGSTSSGVSWLGAGLSFGTTWRDSACVRRLDSRQILAFGVATKDYTHVVAAKELMCDSKKVRAAYERAGIPCVQTQREQAKARQASLSAPAPAVAEIDSSDESTGGIQKAAFEWPNYAEEGG